MLDLLLPQLIDRCRDERLELCVLMIDVDYFKQPTTRWDTRPATTCCGMWRG